jgi:hypothetical protein
MTIVRDQDLVGRLGPVAGTAEVKVFRQAPDMILVGMGQQEDIDIKPTLAVAAQVIEFLPQLTRNVWRVGVVVIGVRPDINVDEDATAGFQEDQRHIAIANAEM